MTVTVDQLQAELAEIGRQYSAEIAELKTEQEIRALQARSPEPTDPSSASTSIAPRT